MTMPKHCRQCFFGFIFLFFCRWFQHRCNIDLVTTFIFALAKIAFIYLIYKFLLQYLQQKKHSDLFRKSILAHLKEFVKTVPEYRRTSKGNLHYKLEDILMLEIMARLSKCISRADIIKFGELHLKRFQAHGMFFKGIPSESTLCRISQGIKHESMADMASAFASVFYKETIDDTVDIICIDGKAMKGTVYENGRNPDIVSAFSTKAAFTIATDICQKKSNEITAAPRLLDKIDVSGNIITADAMYFQKAIINKIRQKGGDYVIELKANQKSLRYGIEDSIKMASPLDSYKEGPVLEHGRIETRTCKIYTGKEHIKDRDKWNEDFTIIEILTSTEKKSDNSFASEQRLYLSNMTGSAELFNKITKQHWSIESMHWCLDRNLQQDRIKRKTEQAARNLDTIQRIVLTIIAAWKNRRKKVADKQKGVAKILRELSMNFTKMLHFLNQK